MKGKVLAFVLVAAVAAFAQRGGGHAGGPPAGGMGAGMGHSMGSSHSDMGPSNSNSNSGKGSTGMSQTQQPLKPSQINGGAFKMLEKRTGMTSAQLQDLFKSSGAK
ncbi:MAG TPA: hypothetical protein VE825_04120, partial [Terriglobales bacterium]|nr:hypothetical protein [Terriglobales bacterium]